MRISDWSSDVCSSDLAPEYRGVAEADIVTKNGPGPDFDEEGDPRSSELFAPQTIDQDDIALGVIHLNQVEKSLACIFAGVRFQIGRTQVCTPVTNAHLVCRILLET